MSVVHECAQFVHRVLTALKIRAGGHVAARSHHLDEVDAGLGSFADGRLHANDAIGLAAEEVAMSGGGCHRCARHEQVRAGHVAVADGLTHIDGNMRGRAEVSKRRNASFDGCFGVLRHAQR